MKTTNAVHSNRQLGALVLVGLLAAASVLLFPQPPRHEGRASVVFSVWLRTERATTAQLYYDLGGGFHERLSSRLEVKPAAALAEYTFALPSGKVEGLRFDPTDTDAPMTLARASLKNEAGEVVRSFSPDDFVASQQIDRLEHHGDELIVHPVKGANDSALLVKLAAPLVLPGVPSAETVTAETHARALERALAAGLLALGGALGWLVRQATPSDHSAPRKPSRGLEIATVAWAGFCVLYSRRPDVMACPQFWAEDGTIFFRQLHALGWKAAFVTHGGYLHLLPRLTAGLADFVGAAVAPLIYLAAALLVVLLALVKATSPRVGLPFPYACALAIVLAPNMDEIAFNLTNAQWFGAIVLLLIACSRPPATRAELAGDLAAVVALGLSGPFSVFFLPLFVVRAFRWRTHAVLATTFVVAVMAAMQLFAYWHSPAPPSFGTPFSLSHALAGAGYRTGGQLLNVLPTPLATNPIPWGWCGLGLWLLLWLALPVAREFRVTKFMLFAAALLMLAGGLWRYRETVDVFFQRIHVQRYLHLPLVATFWLVLAAIENASGWKNALFVSLGLLVLARNVPWYRVAPNFDYDWPSHAARLSHGETMDAPINPAGWTLHVEPPKSE